MAGFDVGMLLNTRGIAPPDPVEQFARMQSLGELARRGRMGALEEEETRRSIGAKRAYEEGLPALMAADFSADSLAQFARDNPQAAVLALKEGEARRKARLDAAKTDAETKKALSSVRKEDLSILGGLAQSVLTRQDAGPQEYAAVAGIMQRMGYDPRSFGDVSGDPRRWLESVASSSIDAAKQVEFAGQRESRAETKRSNEARELHNKAVLAETTRGNDLSARTRLQAANIAASASMENAQATRDAARENASAARDAARTAKISGETTALSKQLEAVSLPNLMTSAGALDQTISKYEQGIPGVGPVSSRIPVLLQGPEGNKVRSQIQAVSNDLLRLYSGGAVTANEAERRATEMMAAGNFSAEDLRNAWPLVRGRINAAIRNVRAGYDPETVSIYEQRGGLKLQPIGESETTGGGVDFVYKPKGAR